jgi:hypothetical protein
MRRIIMPIIDIDIEKKEKKKKSERSRVQAGGSDSTVLMHGHWLMFDAFRLRQIAPATHRAPTYPSGNFLTCKNLSKLVFAARISLL